MVQPDASKWEIVAAVGLSDISDKGKKCRTEKIVAAVGLSDISDMSDQKTGKEKNWKWKKQIGKT